MEHLLFYFFSGVAILSALFVIALPKPTHALLSLIVTMLSLTVLYLLLGAYFVAMTHLIVYAGAVLVLFLFVIMLQGIGAKDIPFRERFKKSYLFLSCFVGVTFFSLITVNAVSLVFPQPAGVQGTVENVGEALFHHFLLPFELTSVLLLLGIFAAIALAKKDQA